MTDKAILDSWKEIANYLGKEVRTCVRWEKELGLPIHRIDSQSSRSPVFAYKSEVDNWLRERTRSRVSRPAFPRAAAGLAAGALALAAVFFVFFVQPRIKRDAASPPALLAKPLTIAVSSFTDQSGRDHERYFSEGLAQEIVSGLERIHGIAVVFLPAGPSQYSAAFESPGGSLWEPDYLLQGAVRRDNNGTTLVLRFLKPKDEKPIWSAEYSEPLGKLSAVKEEIMTRVSETLDLSKTATSSVRRRETVNGSAYEDYLKGNFVLGRLKGESKDPWVLYHQGRYYESRFTAADNELAISLFRRAIALDPGLAEAYVGLADCYANYVNLNWDFNPAWLNRSEDILAKAQGLNADLPQCLRARIAVLIMKKYFFGEDTEKNIRALAGEAVKKFPQDQELNSILAYFHFRKYGEEGRQEDLEKALRFKEKSFWVNPYALGNIVYAEMLLLKGDFDAAIDVCSFLEKVDASNMARFFLGEVQYYRGDLDGSEAIFERFETPNKLRLLSLYHLGMIQARRGDKKSALKTLREIELLSPGEYHFFNDRLKLASIHMGLGERETGYRYLQDVLAGEKSAQDRFIRRRYIALDKNFDGIRQDERFLKLMNGKENM